MDPAVRAIICTRYTEDPAMRGHEQLGFKGALEKPFRAADLREVLSRVLAG